MKIFFILSNSYVHLNPIIHPHHSRWRTGHLGETLVLEQAIFFPYVRNRLKAFHAWWTFWAPCAESLTASSGQIPAAESRHPEQPYFSGSGSWLPNHLPEKLSWWMPPGSLWECPSWHPQSWPVSPASQLHDHRITFPGVPEALQQGQKEPGRAAWTASELVLLPHWLGTWLSPSPFLGLHLPTCGNSPVAVSLPPAHPVPEWDVTPGRCLANMCWSLDYKHIV